MVTPFVVPGYRQWREARGSGNLSDYFDWLDASGFGSPDAFTSSINEVGIDAAMAGQRIGLGGGLQPTPDMSQIPVPGGGLGSMPPPNQPPGPPPGSAPAGAPSFMPPPVQMPTPLPNPSPQGLGGMPMVRDQMMSSVMGPFAQPNWGAPQVDPRFLTQQMPLPGGNTAGVPIGGLGGWSTPNPRLGTAWGGPMPRIPAPQSQKGPM